jgi:hypothetical protein
MKKNEDSKELGTGREFKEMSQSPLANIHERATTRRTTE